MNYLSAARTDVDEATPVLRAMGRLARGYSRLFTESRFAAALSPTQRIRRTGFDARLEVVGVETVATDVVALTLSRLDRTPLPRWTPGAHLDVFTPAGRQRHYSLTGDRFDPIRYRIAVRRVPDGAGSAELHQLRAGDSLHVRGPRNAFPLARATDYMFVAGGIGITPILPMVREVAATAKSWRLIYTGRNRASMPFVDDAVALGADRVQIRPDDEYGVPDLAALLADVSPATALYVCGPAAMIDQTQEIAVRSTDPVELHSERFSPPPIVGGKDFSVVLARSGVTVEVGAAESALDAIRRAHPEVRYSCRQGFCGACRVRVLDGDVEHRDRVLIGDERSESMMICVSRALAERVVIDL